MKRIVFHLMVMAMGIIVFTACTKSEGEPQYTPVLISDGLYVVCGGNVANNINGSLTYVDYATGTTTQRAFYNQNHRNLGLTPNDGLVYGSKLYIVVNGENTIEVCDAKTLRSIKQIKLVDIFGAERANNPRCISAYDGNIYVTTYGTSTAEYEGWSVKSTSGNGYVLAIDTVSFNAGPSYEVGSYPEGLAIYKDFAFVANSDYSACLRPSVSVINLETGEKDTYTSDKLYNPTKIAVAGSDIYVLDMGNYADVKAEVKKMNVSKNKLSVTVQSVMDATAVCFMGTKIYGINSPYGATEATYEVYDIRTAQKTTFTNDGVVSPVLIEADPVNNKVYIASYQIDTATGYPAYSSNAYIAEYAADGSKQNEYECGVGPNAIVFNTRVEYIKFND